MDRSTTIGCADLDTLTACKHLLADLKCPYLESKEVLSRLAHEGVPFLTKVLPQLSKHVLACIKADKWSDLHAAGICGFRLVKTILGRIPLIGFSWILTYFTETDVDAKALALAKLRQLCEYFYKLAAPFTDEQQYKAKKAFVALNAEVGAQEFDAGHVAGVRRTIAHFFPDLFTKDGHSFFFSKNDVVNPDQKGNARRSSSGAAANLLGLVDDPIGLRKLESNGIVPSDMHAFSGHYRLSKRPSMKKILRLYERGGEAASYADARLQASTLHLNKGESVGFLPRRVRPIGYRVSELVLVNKDSRGPRKICKEPYELIEFQMGFHHTLREYLQRQSNGKIQFTSQDSFKAEARKASVSGEKATLDLKDASDSVSIHFVRRILHNSVISWHMDRFRSTAVRVPGLGDYALEMVAGMGSGYTFPVMALVIWASIVSTCGWRFAQHVMVYGDDVIVPAVIAEKAMCALRKSGLKVNEDKSFISGPFRESCGGDYLSGFDVSPVRLKLAGCNLRIKGTKFGPERRVTRPMYGEYLTKLERHCRELIGFPRLREYYYELIEQSGVPLPPVSALSGCLGRVSTDYEARLQTIGVGSYPCQMVEHLPGRKPKTLSVAITNPKTLISAMHKHLSTKVQDRLPHLNDGDIPIFTSVDHRYKISLSDVQDISIHERFPGANLGLTDVPRTERWAGTSWAPLYGRYPGVGVDPMQEDAFIVEWLIASLT